MKKLILILIFIQGVIMGAKLDFVEINNTKIPFIFENETNLPIISLQIVFQKSGSIEDKNLPGLARFSARILNQGTKKLGNVGFAKKLEERAIHFGVSTGIETMVFEMSALKSEFKKGAKLLKELFDGPNITEEAYEKVKTNTLGMLLKKESDYDYIASVNLKKILFKNTPLENPSDGTIESIKKIKLEDIKDFINRHIALKRAIIVMGGDIEIDDAKKLIKDILKDIPVGEMEKLGFYNASDKKENVIIKKDTKQSYIYFGAPFYMNIDDEENYIARVASYILGAGGFGSRLMEEIRVKRGLAYSAYSRMIVNKSHSYFSGYLQTKLESQDEAIKVVKEVIKDFVKNGATQKELDSAKKFLLGSEPLRNETLSQRLSRAFNEYYRGKPLGYSKKELEKIEKLNLKDLNRFIKSHPEITNLSFSIVTK
ncbi:M16 family metallopeptidase [Nitrosophilus kaiyonis]|uniref:M16 family metallopeptidase n=1 Tax=Nitrosophilus kaiyonis TaxID=2930200 RepID=UPI0024901262|nr:pitrilysin family protein [Nitrosophilus kaiyonis]